MTFASHEYKGNMVAKNIVTIDDTKMVVVKKK